MQSLFFRFMARKLTKAAPYVIIVTNPLRMRQGSSGKQIPHTILARHFDLTDFFAGYSEPTRFLTGQQSYSLQRLACQGRSLLQKLLQCLLKTGLIIGGLLIMTSTGQGYFQNSAFQSKTRLFTLERHLNSNYPCLPQTGFSIGRATPTLLESEPVLIALQRRKKSEPESKPVEESAKGPEKKKRGRLESTPTEQFDDFVDKNGNGVDDRYERRGTPARGAEKPTAKKRPPEF